MSFSPGRGPGQTAQVCSRSSRPAGGPPAAIAELLRATSAHRWSGCGVGILSQQGSGPHTAHRLCLVPAACTPGSRQEPWEGTALLGAACTPPSSRNPEGGISIGTHGSGGEQPGRSIRPGNGQAWNVPQRAGSPSCTGGLSGRCDPNMSPAHPKAQVCCGRRDREDPCFSLTGGGGARRPLILQTPREDPPIRRGLGVGQQKRPETAHFQRIQSVPIAPTRHVVLAIHS